MGGMREQYVQLYSAVAAPYGTVRDLLETGRLPMLRSPKRLSLRRATFADEAGLSLDLPGLHLVDEIEFTAEPPFDVPGRIPLTRMRLTWAPTERRELHPTISADLEIEPIDESRTMVSLLASYVPPLGRLGAVVDRVALHRVTEAALRDYFGKLVLQIRQTLPATTGNGQA